jgi:hypothetical protein
MNGTGFRSMVSNNRLAVALVAAFVSTHMATVTGYWYRMIGLVNGQGFVTLDWPAFNGLLIRPGATPFGSEQFTAGAVYHMLTGICFGLIFAFLIHPMLRIKNSTRGNLLKGLIWGMILALISALWWTPSLFPDFNPGFLSLNLGWRTAVGIFIWHAVYGLTLGAFYNPLPDQA